MDFPDIAQPPKKKRRFFVNDPIDDPPAEGHSSSSTASPHYDTDALSATLSNTTPQFRCPKGQYQSSFLSGPNQYDGIDGNHRDVSIGFEKETFESFIGENVASATFEKLRGVSGDNMERAINMYLDGSWTSAASGTRPSSNSALENFNARIPKRPIPTSDSEDAKGMAKPMTLGKMPEYRYVGAFGVGAWATRSGTGLIAVGEAVKIERTKIKPPAKIGRGGKAIQATKSNAARVRTDIIVRFTNSKGEEVGRLPKESADWVSTLMDQKVCHFDGICFLAPERIRVNDTIELQLKCSLLRRAFEASGFPKPEENRTTGFFEEKETSEEKGLRLRQVALVRFFDEINLHTATVNDTTVRHKRQGILQAAEIAEQYDKEKESKKSESPKDDNCTTSTPLDDEEDEGKELEQDQLDSLYKKAQSFDFDTPTREPADTFVMDLRKYQKQALHWMISKEKDEKSDNREISMHPLWEEYRWPVKDMDDREVAGVANQSSFYVNPYSGELSLDFPAQEQHCLGGILADGESYYNIYKVAFADLYRNGSRKDDRNAWPHAYA